MRVIKNAGKVCEIPANISDMVLAKSIGGLKTKARSAHIGQPLTKHFPAVVLLS